MNPDSINAKLKSYSKANRKVHQKTLITFFQERFLYRLSVSEYRANFLLKGGALAYTISREDSRHTKDIDFLLTELKHEQDTLVTLFKEICILDGKDGVTFNPNTIKVEEIRKEGNYNGTRIRIMANLGKTSQQMQIDIGLGDHVTPGPQEIVYPTILDQLEAPKLLAYSIETLVSEKFNAMVDLGEFNSRLKDFYDIYLFIDRCNKLILEEAIKNTFRRRHTSLVIDPPVFQEAFYLDGERLKQWNNFIEKNKLTEIKFQDIYNKILEHLEPIYTQLK